jgi:general bacterial porin, GBP family
LNLQLTARSGYAGHVKPRRLDVTKLEPRNHELNFKYAVTPLLTVGTAYILTTGDFDAKPGSPGKTPKWNQINLGMDYSLSRRTMLYLVGAYQRANGDARQSSLQPSLLGSSGRPHRANDLCRDARLR